MAIAEAEPKKSEVAVTSTGLSESEGEVLKEERDKKCLLRLRPGNQSLRSASDSTTSSPSPASALSPTPTPSRLTTSDSHSSHGVTTYDLYNSTTDFSFSMPGGWNDQDLSIFVKSCWENLEALRTSSSDKNLRVWHEIARLGAKRSLNPTLYNVNSCLEFAQCIKTYIKKNEKLIDDNEAFKLFYNDVSNLLPHFPPDVEGLTRRGRSKSVELNTKVSIEFHHSKNKSISKHSLQSNVSPLKSGDEHAWSELQKFLKAETAVNADALNQEKKNIVDTVMKEKIRSREDFFVKKAQHYLDAFEYTRPHSAKKSDFLSTSDGVMDSEGKVDSSDRDEQSTVGIKRTSSQSSQHENVLVDRTPVVVKKRRGRPPKLKLEERQRITNEEDRGEPTSTTLIGEPAFSELDKGSDVQEFDKVKSLTKGNKLEGQGVKDWEGQGVGRGKRTFRRERTPTRVLPSRNVKYSIPDTPKSLDYTSTTKSRALYNPKRRNLGKVQLDEEKDSTVALHQPTNSNIAMLESRFTKKSIAEKYLDSAKICKQKLDANDRKMILEKINLPFDGSKENVSITTADSTKKNPVVLLKHCASPLKNPTGQSKLLRSPKLRTSSSLTESARTLHQLDGTKMKETFTQTAGNRQGGGCIYKTIEPDRDKSKGGKWVGGGDDGCPGITCSTAKVCERETESASAPSQTHPKSLSTKEPVQGNSVTDAFPSFLSSSASSSGTAAAPADAGHSRSTSLHCPPYSVDTVPCTSTSSTPTPFQSHSGDYLDSPTSSIANCTSIMENADTTLPKKNMTSQVVALPTSATVALNKYQEQMNVMYQCVSSSQSQSCSLPEPDKSNPHWFTEFRKYDMWKMQLLQAEHQRLMDIESRRLDIDEEILKSLNVL